MRKYLIQPTKYNYYSEYIEWLEYHNVKEEVILRYLRTSRFLQHFDQKRFKKKVLKVLLEAPHLVYEQYKLVLCEDNRGEIYLLDKEETKPFWKVGRF